MNTVQIKPVNAFMADSIYSLIDKNRAILRQWLPWVDHTNCIEDSNNFISLVTNLFENEDAAFFSIIKDEVIVGVVGATKSEEYANSMNINYWIDLAHTSQGITTKSVQLIVDYLSTNWNIKRFFIKSLGSNQASIRVAEKLQFQRNDISFEPNGNDNSGKNQLLIFELRLKKIGYSQYQ